MNPDLLYVVLLYSDNLNIRLTDKTHQKYYDQIHELCITNLGRVLSYLKNNTYHKEHIHISNGFLFVDILWKCRHFPEGDSSTKIKLRTDLLARNYNQYNNNNIINNVLGKVGLDKYYVKQCYIVAHQIIFIKITHNKVEYYLYIDYGYDTEKIILHEYHIIGVLKIAHSNNSYNIEKYSSINPHIYNNLLMCIVVAKEIFPYHNKPSINNYKLLFKEHVQEKDYSNEKIKAAIILFKISTTLFLLKFGFNFIKNKLNYFIN
jgi:hypothetical protein